MTYLSSLLLPQAVHAPHLAAGVAVVLLALVHWVLSSGRSLLHLAAVLPACMLAVALGGGASIWMSGPVEWVLAEHGVLRFSLFFDALSCLMLGLVGFLGIVVSRFSLTCLEGNPGRSRFMGWLAATQLSVGVLVTAGNLLFFIAAWMAVSLCLHRLLLFYPGRPGARLAAWKKFAVSRLGDVCLVGACILVWQEFCSFEFSTVFAQSAGKGSGGLSPWICGLLVTAALAKSAQFPFHSWLPDTLETPTPVSAFMHAGIINAGGYLVVRMSPLLVQVPAAMDILALAGAFTALFASVIMMTQTSIKKSLAWSTVSQMGFMMLQCGLGAFALAMLHMVAHSLYKACAFLGSGSIVRAAEESWVPAGRPAARPGLVAASLLAAAGVGGLGYALGADGEATPGSFLLTGVFVMALAHLLWTLWGSSMRRQLLVRGLLVASAATAVCFAQHAVFSEMLKGSLPAYRPVLDAGDHVLLVLVGMLFLAVLVFQSQMPAWRGHPALARLYVHASNGFYLGALMNRLVEKSNRNNK